jgi:2-methylcitrate dehydratase PrpD
MNEITRALARHATELSYDDLPAEVVEKTGQHVLDLIAIMCRAAADADSSPSVRTAVLSLAGSGQASVVGHRESLGPAHAALLNGTYAHSLDFDDTHREGSIHPGAAVIPAVIAAGEQAGGVDGKTAIAAIVAGYDVTCKLAMAIDPKSHYDRGFHPTGTCGAFGAAAAVCRVLGLSAEECESALGVIGSRAAASLQFFDNGAWNKRFHPGFAAHDAIFAAELARNGFVGAAHPLEGPHGFFHGYSDAAVPERAVQDLGKRFEILHTAIKPYPACRYAHAPLDAIIEIVTANDLSPDDVRRVRVGLSDAGFDLIANPLERKRSVANVVDGQFSMPFLAAVAVVRRRMVWSDYDLVGDRGVDALMQRVDAVRDAEANRVYPGRWLATVEVETNRGTFSDSRWEARGEPENPLGWDDLQEKFDDLAATVPPEQRYALADTLRRLDELDDLRELGRLLRGGAAVGKAPA